MDRKGEFRNVAMDDSDGLVSYMENHTVLKAADVWVTPSRVALPHCYLNDAEKIYNMEVRPDDTWVITFPKCGTTWTQEMVWLINNNCDYEKASQLDLDQRFPFVELNSLGVVFRYDNKSMLEIAIESKSPRFIKSHLPVALLPHQLWTVKPKIIYTMRHPIAAALSYYHHYTLFNSYTGDLNHFLDAFLKDQIDYSPYWSHVLSFWSKRDEPNMLFLRFEQLKDNLAEEIKKVASFLGKELTSAAVERLAKHLDFPNMKDNPRVNKIRVIKTVKGDEADKYPFIRKGDKEEWRTRLSKEYIDKFSAWMTAGRKGSDFPYYDMKTSD